MAEGLVDVVIGKVRRVGAVRHDVDFFEIFNDRHGKIIEHCGQNLELHTRKHLLSLISRFTEVATIKKAGETNEMN